MSEGLSERQKKILSRLSEGEKVKIKDVAKEMYLGESTARNELTKIYEKLGINKITDDDQEKRRILVERYGTSLGRNPPLAPSERHAEGVSDADTKPVKVNLPPPIVGVLPPPRASRRPFWIGVLAGGIFIGSVAVLLGLTGIISFLSEVTPDPTDTLVFLTFTDTFTDTKIPPTFTYTPTAITITINPTNTTFSTFTSTVSFTPTSTPVPTSKPTKEPTDLPVPTQKPPTEDIPPTNIPPQQTEDNTPPTPPPTQPWP